jgi:hypothetical protein
MPKLTETEISERVCGRDSICSGCAEEHGAEWPTGHQATFWVGKCGFCGFSKTVCCTSDWNWPLLNRKTQHNVRINREI